MSSTDPIAMEVNQEAVAKGEVDDVRSQPPAGFGSLFEAGSQGEMTT